jgi:hypothetical protein
VRLTDQGVLYVGVGICVCVRMPCPRVSLVRAQVFAEPLKLRLTTSEFAAIFSNLAELLPCNEAILAALEQRQREERYLVQRLGVRVPVCAYACPRVPVCVHVGMCACACAYIYACLCVLVCVSLVQTDGRHGWVGTQALLTSLFPSLTPYLAYCSNQYHATQTLTRKIQTDPTFAHIISVRAHAHPS